MMHTDMEVYKDSKQLVKYIYTITNDFPKEELWGLTAQMKRAVISIPSNIAEGCGRKSKKELINFLNISLGSVTELSTQLELAEMLGFVKYQDKLQQTNEQLLSVKRQLIGLIRTLRKGQD